MADERPALSRDETYLLAAWLDALLQDTKSTVSGAITPCIANTTAQKLISSLRWLAKYAYDER